MLTRGGFPIDIATARDAFLAAADRAGLRPRCIEPAGPSRAALDWVRLGAPEAPNLLILGTGASGRASFAAAGAVTHLVSDKLRRLLPGPVQALVIHAVTLSGPLWAARGDIPDQDSILAGQAGPRAGTRASTPAPDSWTSALLDAADRRFRDYVRAVRTEAQARAEARGEGILRPAFMMEALREILRDVVPVPARVAILDLRAGPGRFGHCEMEAAAPAASRAAIRAHDWFGAALPARGLPPPRAIGGLADLLPDAETIPVVAEFGTRRGEDLLLGGALSGGSSDPLPSNAAWRQVVLDGAERLVETAIAKLVLAESS